MVQTLNNILAEHYRFCCQLCFDIRSTRSDSEEHTKFATPLGCPWRTVCHHFGVPGYNAGFSFRSCGLRSPHSSFIGPRYSMGLENCIGDICLVCLRIAYLCRCTFPRRCVRWGADFAPDRVHCKLPDSEIHKVQTDDLMTLPCNLWSYYLTNSQYT